MWRELLASFVEEKIENLDSIYEELNSRDKINYLPKYSHIVYQDSIPWI